MRLPWHRSDITKLDGFYYDVNADYDFKLGPGRLKLIGLRHLDHEPIIETLIDSYHRRLARQRHPLHPQFAHRRNDRPRRIWLENRQERLAGDV